MRITSFFTTVIPLLALVIPAHARIWTDSTGEHTLEAELVDSDNETAVLKTPEGKLVSVPTSWLSSEDRRYIQEDKAGDRSDLAPSTSAGLVWRLRDGSRIRGKIVDYYHGKTVASLESGVVRVRGGDSTPSRILGNLR